MTGKKQKKARRTRVLASLLALSISLPTLSGIPVFAAEAGAPEELPEADWHHCTACSMDVPHLISAKEDLDRIRTHINAEGRIDGYFQLTDDIIFEEADFAEGGQFYNDGLGWLPIGHDGLYNGKGADAAGVLPTEADIWLDGGGCTISGLTIHCTTGLRELAFISRPGNATIQNLTFENANIYSNRSGAILFAEDSPETLTRNITIQDSVVTNHKSYNYTGLYAASLRGTVENAVVRNSTCTHLDGDGTPTHGWGQTLFIGQTQKNAVIRNVTITDCTVDAYAYATMFIANMQSGTSVENVTIQNLNYNASHDALLHLAGQIWDSAVQNPNADRENIRFRNVNLDAAVNYHNDQYRRTEVFPEMPGFELSDSVLVYRQNYPVALTLNESEANPGEFENVYLVLEPEGGERTVVYCKPGEGQVKVELPLSLTLAPNASFALPELPGGTASYSAEGTGASVSPEGVIQAAAEGSAEVLVSVQMSSDTEPLPLARIAVAVSAEAGPVDPPAPPAADKKELESLCAQMAAKENEGFTDESWNAFQAALAAAQAVLNDETANQDAVEKAMTALRNAADHLKKPAADLTNLTIDGKENASVYLPETGGILMQLAAQELKDYVRKISGAELPDADVLSDEKLQIVLATPDTVPEIEELFADDLNAIGELDGFAVRQKENRIYILGTNERGVQNGVYDFLTENTGIIWTRADEELGTLYKPQSTIAVQKADYREIPSFPVRGCAPCGDNDADSYNRMLARNKQNSLTATTYLSAVQNGTYDKMNAVGIKPLLLGHVMSNWLPNDKYFESHPEYYLTYPDGTPKPGSNGFTQLNFYNPGTAEAVAYEVCEFLKESKEDTVGIALGDSNYFVVVENGVELNRQPFTADNGVTVYPDDENYKSTVFFNFLNRVAKIVGEKYPDVKINTFAYIFAEVPPAVDIAENINIVFAPLNGDDHLPIETSAGNSRVRKYIEGWSAKTKNLYLYSYWNCLLYSEYPRPLPWKVQQDLHYLKDMGFVGIGPESVGDTAKPTDSSHNWDINGMYFWMMQQLFWDMDADLDALKAHYCDLAYGPAASDMLEFYRLIEEGWGATDDFVWYITGGDTYIKKFIIDAGHADSVLAALDAAYAAAETDLQRARIEPIKSAMEKEIPFYEQFPEEDGAAYYSDAGHAAITAPENLSDIAQGPWAEAEPMTEFRTDKMAVPAEKVEVRLLWDEENLYIAYVNYDTRVGTPDDGNDPSKIEALLPSENWFKGSQHFMETYLCGDANQLFDFRAYYSDAKGNTFCYLPGIEFDSDGPKWNAYYGAHTSENPSERYWVNVQVVPFADMGVTAKTARLYGTFVSNSVRGADVGTATYYGWCGANVWSTAAFRPITLKEKAAPADLTKLTIDGKANAGIYLSDGANDLLKLAQKEMQDTVKKISGADLPALSALSEEGLQIVLATPDTVPEISALFAEDLAWIGSTDGFAVRTLKNKIYIIANEGRGVLNGVYDFLEENTGILWTRGVDELGTLYQETPTISVVKADYREKSPFQLRGWNACGQGAGGTHHADPATRWFEGRNKLNARVGTMGGEIGNIVIDGKTYTGNGHIPLAGAATLPIDKYFDSHPEYFMTNADGTPKKSQYGSNLNFYSMEAADAVAEELYAAAQKNKLEYVSHSIQDNQYFCMVVPDETGKLVDLASKPFTADNGVTVTPDMDNYKSTVFFNFLNRAAKKLKMLDPELKIVSLAYIYCEYPPAVEIEDNIVIQFAPIYSDDHLPIETAASNEQVKENLTGWAEKTKNIVVYNYYGSLPCTIYSRPIAKKVQQDFQFYHKLGLLGLTPEGGVDSAPGYENYDAWNMNHLYYWLIDRLMWDPYADLDALTKEFCDKAYGAGSEAMQEYYRLIQSGWDMFDDYVWYTSGGDTYIKKFIIDAGVGDAASAALAEAYAAADIAGKKRIALIQEVFGEQLEKYQNFVPEDGIAYRTDLGKDALVSEENLSVTSGPWSKIKPMTVFKNPDLVDAHRAIEVRMMWDDENVYVAYKVPNELIGTAEDPYKKVPPLTADGSWWNGGPEFMETYLCGNMTNMSEYYAFYTDAIDQQMQYGVGPAFMKGPYSWESHSAIIADGEPADRYWMNVLVVPFETLGVTSKTATLGGTFVANIYGGPGPYYGWCGSNVWSTASFRLIEMVDDIPEKPPVEEPEKPVDPVLPSRPESSGSSSSGAPKWVQMEDGHWEYHAADGTPLTGWQKIRGVWYYMDEAGRMLTGWQKINGVWYYLRSWGGMATGWQKVNGIWYYLKDWGGMATGWQKVDGYWYYLKEWGGMATGWLKLDRHWFYLTDWGGMATGWQKSGNNWYYLKSWGGMAVNTKTPDGYFVDSYGVWVR